LFAFQEMSPTFCICSTWFPCWMQNTSAATAVSGFCSEAFCKQNAAKACQVFQWKQCYKWPWKTGLKKKHTMKTHLQLWNLHWWVSFISRVSRAIFLWHMCDFQTKIMDEDNLYFGVAKNSLVNIGLFIYWNIWLFIWLFSTVNFTMKGLVHPKMKIKSLTFNVPLRYQYAPFRYKSLPFEKVPPQWPLLYLFFWESPPCCTNPVRPSFVFGTQMKIFLIKFERWITAT